MPAVYLIKICILEHRPQSCFHGIGPGMVCLCLPKLYGYLILLSRYNFCTRLLLLSSNMPSVLLPRKMVVLNIFAFVSSSINENAIACYVEKKNLNNLVPSSL